LHLLELYSLVQVCDATGDATFTEA